MKDSTRMHELIRIILPRDILPLAQNQSAFRHAGTNSRLRKASARDAYNCWVAAGKPTTLPEHWPVRLDIIVRRSAQVDHYNIHGACKWMIDALFKEAITPDDNPRFLEPGETVQQISRDYLHRPEVEFVVRSASDLPARLLGRPSKDYGTLLEEARQRAYQSGFQVMDQINGKGQGPRS
jgi:hypothetical protein